MTGTRTGRRRRTLVASSLVVLVAAACTPMTPDAASPTASDDPTAEEDGPALLVASGPEAEAQLLARTVAVLLVEQGIAADPLALADGRSVRQAVELGDVDVAVVYSGEEWLTSLGRPDPPADALEGLEVLAAADRPRGLVWLVPEREAVGGGVPADATFAFFVAGPPSVHADLRSLSELSLRLSEQPALTLCVDAAFARGNDGLPALLSTYSVRRDRPFIAVDPSEAVRRVRDGDCVAGLSSATDGRAWGAGLSPLADDLRFFPAFVPVPVVRAGALVAAPRVGEALRPLVDGLSTAVLGRANARVVAGEDPQAVAEALAAELVLRAAPAPR